MSAARDPETDQPLPVRNDSPSMHDLVVEHLTVGLPMMVHAGDRAVVAAVARDLLERKAQGLAKYGSPLQTGNGRSFVQDAYEEALDAAAYTRGLWEENRDDSNIRDIYDTAVALACALQEVLQRQRAA